MTTRNKASPANTTNPGAEHPADVYLRHAQLEEQKLAAIQKSRALDSKIGQYYTDKVHDLISRISAGQLSLAQSISQVKKARKLLDVIVAGHEAMLQHIPSVCEHSAALRTEIKDVLRAYPDDNLYLDEEFAHVYQRLEDLSVDGDLKAQIGDSQTRLLVIREIATTGTVSVPENTVSIDEQSTPDSDAEKYPLIHGFLTGHAGTEEQLGSFKGILQHLHTCKLEIENEEDKLDLAAEIFSEYKFRQVAGTGIRSEENQERDGSQSQYRDGDEVED